MKADYYCYCVEKYSKTLVKVGGLKKPDLYTLMYDGWDLFLLDQ
jgi:hypothetical protein